MKRIILVLLLSFTILLPTTLLAKTHKVGPYEVSIGWKQSGKKIKIWGKVNKGKNCNNLKVKIDLRNARNHDHAHIEDRIDSYRTSNVNAFSGKDRSVTPSNSKYDINSKKYWKLDRLSITCGDKYYYL